mgnify:CR=1 FL=1
MTFAEFIREKRLALRLNLRSFCMTFGEDPSNWSKMERGLLRAPTDKDRLNEIAQKLNLSGAETETLIDAAFADKGRIPPDLMNDANLVPHLPVVFRALREGDDIPKRLNELAEQIRKGMQGE